MNDHLVHDFAHRSPGLVAFHEDCRRRKTIVSCKNIQVLDADKIVGWDLHYTISE